MTDIQFYQASQTGGGFVGGEVTSTVVDDITTGDLVAPPHGEGSAWTYDKYFLNLTGGGTVNNVTLYVVASTHPEQVLFANTPYANDFLSGDRTNYGDQSELIFYSGDTLVDRPDFVSAHGEPDALALYNQSGVLGGDVLAEPGTGNALPFWIARRLDEHIPSGETYFSVEVAYGT